MLRDLGECSGGRVLALHKINTFSVPSRAFDPPFVDKNIPNVQRNS